MGCQMLDTNLKVDDTRANIERGSAEIMYDFLRLSTRPDTSGQAMHDHLLTSLAIALGAGKVIN